MESIWQAHENNTPFTFWLLLRGIPGVCGKKVRESGVRLQASGVRRANSSRHVGLLRSETAVRGGFPDACGLKPDACSSNAFYTQKSDRPHDGSRLGLRICLSGAVRQRRQSGSAEYLGDG